MTKFQIFSIGMACGAILLTMIATGTDAHFGETEVIIKFEKRLVMWCLKFIGALTVFVAVLAMAGCAGFSDPAKPQSEAEMFPVNCGTPAKGVVRENGPVGIILMTGTAPSQVCVFDQGGRFVDQWGFRGTDRFALASNGRPYQIGMEKRLDPGCYRMDIYSFFKDISFLRGEQLFILPKQSTSLCTGNPTAFNIPIWGSTTGGFYGWRLDLTANIRPRGNYATPYTASLLQIISPF